MLSEIYWCDNKKKNDTTVLSRNDTSILFMNIYLLYTKFLVLYLVTNPTHWVI